MSALLAQATPSPSVSTPSSDAVLFRALDRLRAYQTPPYVVYMTEEDGVYHRIAFRGTDEMMNDAALPTGSTLPPARVYRAFVGPLSYSLHEAIATPAPEATPQPPSPTDLETTLRTIAVVSSRGHLYDVSVATPQTIDGHATYHIVLHPRRDPDKNAIRDLWIDRSNYDVVRADYVYSDPPDFQEPGSKAYLTVNFQTVGAYRIAANWIAIYHAPDLRTPVYRELKVVKMSFPASLPDWLFDASAYREHERAHDPDYLTTFFNAPPK
ncbi:MAG TPA: hypothetical protein VFN49_00210 [Candidatus Aquilonibacter sp.]|nr:hypothetical protein [Candidatus Aquilonibacter sp.]